MAAEVEAATAASASAIAAGSAARGTRRLVEPGEHDEDGEQDDDADGERVDVAAQRGGPARSDEQDEARRERAPRRDRERQHEREAEDRGEDRAAHLEVHTRVERRLHVVEVEEAVPEARSDRAGEVPRVHGRHLEGEPRAEDGGHEDRGDAGGARTDERGQERERGDADRPERLVERALEPEPRGGNDDGRHDRDRERPRQHAPPGRTSAAARSSPGLTTATGMPTDWSRSSCGAGPGSAST